MGPEQARGLVSDTFTRPFDRERFLRFARELLKRLDTSGGAREVCEGPRVAPAFADSIGRHERLGTYTAPGGELIDVIAVHLRRATTDESERAVLRNFAAHRLTARGLAATLAAFVSPGSNDWRFSLVKLERAFGQTGAGGASETTALTSARRSSFVAGRGEKSHTARKHFLPLLGRDGRGPTLAELEEAFDAGRVAREFFARYRRLFERVRGSLDSALRSGRPGPRELARNGDVAGDLAKKLLAQITFLHFLRRNGRLVAGRGAARGDGDKNILRRLFDCQIPFPRGDERINTDFLLPDELLSDEEGAGVLDVFDRYDFTLYEAEASERDVAVDPEILGKVFEHLLPGNLRRRGGAYYTPRAVVGYMCRQCLVNHLATRMPELPRADIETFIRADFDADGARAREGESLPETIGRNAARVDGLLERMTVYDPAVGAGAFLVRMLREIVRARRALAAALGAGGRDAYELKRHAVEHSLYGVDVDPGAVSTAKLRLWLSLAADGDGGSPLPNLDDNVTHGDSLLDARAAGGFDVVIANPPYVEFKSLDAETKRKLKAYKSARGKYDLYIPFLEKIDGLLNADGNAIVLCPTRFMQRDYGAGIRQFFRDRYQLREIIDFGGLQIFAGATNYTGVFAFTKKKEARYDFTVRKALKARATEDELSAALRAPARTPIFDTASAGSEMITSAPWFFHSDASRPLMEKVRSAGVRLASLCEGIYQGVATGKDSVFVVSGEEARARGLEGGMLQPMLKGKDIGPYRISWAGSYVIYPYDDAGNVVDESTLRTRFPRTYAYLRLKREELRGRTYFDASRKQWFELWNQRRLKRFRRAKLVTLDNASRNSFAYDDGGFVGTTTVYSLILNDPSPDTSKCVLGVLNSSLLDYYHRQNTTPQAGGFYRYQAMFINGLPVRTPAGVARKELVALVDEILDARRRDARADTRGPEREIDRLVYELYGLNEGETALVEGGACRPG